MFQRIPKSIWFGTLFSAIVLGIVSGIAYPQNTLATAIPLEFGWLYLPFSLSSSSVDSLTHTPEWLILLTTFYYPLAALVMAACVVWTVRSTGKRLDALLIAGLLACGSALVCILVGLIAPHVFNALYEMPAGLAICAVSFQARHTRSAGRQSRSGTER